MNFTLCKNSNASIQSINAQINTQAHSTLALTISLPITEEIKQDLIIMVWVLLYLTLSIIVPKYLKDKNIISKRTARKLIHNFSGLAIFSAPYLNYPILAFIMAVLMTILTRKSSRESQTKALKELFEAISEEEELKIGYLQGPFAYCLAISILVFIFLFLPHLYYFPIAAVLIMMYADSAAAWIGRRYGKHKIKIPFIGDKRTIEGSLAFFITSFIITIFVFQILGKIIPGFSDPLTITNIYSLAIIMSITATLLELISPSKYDDLIIPIGSTIIITLYYYLTIA